MKPSRKIKRANNSSQLVLEEIIGLTTKDGSGLASNASTSTFAYLAGSVVVVYNMNSGTQSHFMVSHRSPKRLSCVALSQDGRFVAAGEAGRHSSVVVWDSATLSFISELKGHLHGVACISFSPDGKHLVSVGGYMYLWDWRSGELVTKLQATSSCSTISSVTFSSDAKSIVTAGKRHLKFWVLRSSRRTQLNGGKGRTTSFTIHGKPSNLAIQRGSSFVSITSVSSCISYNNFKQAGDSFTIYALTDAGILYLIHSGLSVKNSVDLKVKKAFALSVSGKLVACACNNGIVQFLIPESLEYAGRILYSHAKKFYEEKNIVSHARVPEQDFQQHALPDAVACQFLNLEKLVVIYEDHSLYIWNIHDVNQATRCCVLVSHSSCIWDIKNLCCENMHDASLACIARGCSGGTSFATCSADGTIRLWDLALQSDLAKDGVEHRSLKAELMSSSCLVTAGTFERDAVEADVGSQGFRSLAVSSDGKYLAAGDCKGNLHIYDLQTSDYTCFQGVHDAEILTLSFTLGGQDISEEIAKNRCYLASGGRDSIINLYDVNRNFDLINSIDDHSAAVTSIKIASNNCRILSCSADSFLVLHDVAIADSGHKILQHHSLKASHGTVYDMAVDPTFGIVVTVGQDKKLNTFDIAARKLIRSSKQDKDFGDPIKVTMDPSCTYVVCSFSNKSICIYDFITGQMVAKAMGHAEVVTGVIFLPDCKHIVSVDGDGCIFVWKLPDSLSSKILERIMEKSDLLSPRSLAQTAIYSHLQSCEEEFQQSKINPEDVWSLRNNSQSRGGMLYSGSSHREAIAFKFSVSRLPKWAQAKVTSSNIVCRKINNTSLEAYSLSPEVIVPSDHAPSSPETTKTQCLSRPERTSSNFALDNRWLSVYTVCMDALSSPEMQNLMDTKMPKFSSSLRQDKADISKDHTKHEKQGLVSDQLTGCNNSDVSWCEYPKKVCGSTTEPLRLDESESDSKATTAAKLNNLHSEEDSDLFKEHFGSLSNTHKIKTRKSFVPRYSARFVVQQDYPGDYKRLFSTPVRNIADKMNNYEENAATYTLSEDTSLQVIEFEQVKNSFEQDLKNSALSSADSVCELTRCPVKENSVENNLRKDRDQKNSLHKESELEETIIACKETLNSLDLTAESAVQLFSRLEVKSSGEEVLGEAGAQLFNEAAELLPSIIEKVIAVSKLVRCRKNDLCVSGSDKFLVEFDEGKSDRIAEILKEDTSIR